MANKNVAFITGIAGQDGAYLAEFLCGLGYHVHGLLRWDSHPDPQYALGRLRDLIEDGADITLHYGDITDALCVARVIAQVRPAEIYNLAALSHVGVSFDTPASAMDANLKGTLAILDAVRLLEMEAQTRIYQASSSEMFGSAPAPQNEESTFEPCSPYGVSKLGAYWLARVYRDSYNMFVSNGILFNHESPSRSEDFVTRKITHAVARIEAGEDLVLDLGNLDSIRDWGHARDYVRGMWQMLQHHAPDDFVLATGKALSVRDFVNAAFAHAGMRLIWEGAGESETARHAQSGKVLVRVDPALFRPKEVHYLLGDAGKARRILGWRPEYDFNALVADMMNAERVNIRKVANTGEPDTWRKIA